MRILIVEDDVQLNGALKIALESEGYAIDCFYDGIKAERHILLNHSNYDLILLDYMLPNKSGVEICKAVRAADIYTPILMLTAITDTETKVNALDAGADDYQTKPFSMEELTARVRALLRRPKAALPTELRLGELIINPASKHVTSHGQEIKLTLKEFGILEYLVRNVGQVISRDQILDHVWDFSTNAFSNIVDVHITNLRKKLEKANAPCTLETIRGVGFIIKPH
jgi:DNA-binding response OmpR family regulator